MEISGIDINDLHSTNKQDILLILLTFHLDISGIDINKEHPKNKQDILLTLLYLHSIEKYLVMKLMMNIHKID